MGKLLPALNRDSSAPSRGSSSVTDGTNARLAATVGMLREAVAKQPNDADMWEMLGELLAPTDPAGQFWTLTGATPAFQELYFLPDWRVVWGMGFAL